MDLQQSFHQENSQWRERNNRKTGQFVARQPRYPYLTRHFRLRKDIKRVERRIGALANSVSTYRLARHMTQAVLAEKAGVTRKTLNGIEANRTEPKISVVLALSHALNVPVEKLFRLD